MHLKRYGTFLRFSLSGAVFAVLGPLLFWLSYPLGPFKALALAQLIVHAIRFTTFRLVVFKANKGYKVSLPRYVISSLPVALAEFLSVAIFRHRLDRTALTLIGVIISLVVGYSWSHFVYGKASIRLRKLFNPNAHGASS
jgi:putative flippase GtrA